MLCVCGACCDDCPHYGDECSGCETIGGKVFWAQYVGAEICPVFQCVKDNHYQTCGDCSKIPCDLWFTLRDPAWSEEEHKKSITKRVNVLRH